MSPLATLDQTLAHANATLALAHAIRQSLAHRVTPVEAPESLWRK